jgi:undecaprenyl diphosphate synthase
MGPSFAKQSTSHIAVVPEGCGCWSLAPGRDGERSGADAVRRIVRAAPALGVDVLTLQGLSSDAPRGPAEEARSILTRIGAFLELETAAFQMEGVRVTVFGCRERLPDDARRRIEVAERATSGGTRLELRIAIDCSARSAILATVLTGIAGQACLAREPVGRLGPDVDLLIRTGGERRLADFLLWECAHAELCFVDTPWLEFGERDLAAAMADFRRRAAATGLVGNSGAA